MVANSIPLLHDVCGQNARWTVPKLHKRCLAEDEKLIGETIRYRKCLLGALVLHAGSLLCQPQAAVENQAQPLKVGFVMVGPESERPMQKCCIEDWFVDGVDAALPRCN
jgi:hypothetical protein